MMEQLFSEEQLYALGWTLLHSVWQVLLVSLLLWLALLLFRNKSSAFKYRLSFIALTVIFLCSLVTFQLEISKSNTGRDKSAFDVSAIIMEKEDIHHQKLSITVLKYPLSLSFFSTLERQLPNLVKIWFFGSILFLIKMGSSLADLRALNRKPKKDLSKTVLSTIKRHSIALKIKRNVCIYASQYVDTPLTYGILKPIILVPAGLVFQLSPAQLEAILLHELSHIKRYDYLANLFQSGMQCIYFYHPAFWYIHHALLTHREEAADDMTIRMGIDPRDLANGVATALNYSNNTYPEMALAAANKKYPTLNRIKRMMGIKENNHKIPPLFSTLMAVVLFFGITLIVGASSEKKQVNYLSTQLFTKTLGDTHTISLPRPMIQAPGALDTIPEPDDEENGWEWAYSFEMDTNIFHFDFPFLESMPPIDFPPFPVPDMSGMDFAIWEELDFDTVTFPMEPLAELENHFFILRSDTSKWSKEDREKWKEELKALAKKSAEMSKEWQQKNQGWLKEFHENQKVWQEQFAESHKAWQEEFQEKRKEWEKEYKPKMEEFQQKMKEWQKENQKNLEEMQEKLMKLKPDKPAKSEDI